MPEPIVLSWSSGKDSAWALQLLNDDPSFEVVGLLTTFNTDADRVAMHAVRRELVDAQARSAGLPLIRVEIPERSDNGTYEEAFGAGLRSCAKRFGVERFAFGDLFLEDIRAYRERHLRACGFGGVYPLWGRDTAALSRQMLAGGLRAWLTCVDGQQLNHDFSGRAYDETLLTELPAGVDPCGENGEFHTFTWAGPMLKKDVQVEPGERVVKDRFAFTDLVIADGA
ncbi:MAG: ATP-binding protein [Gammaproteobacteria bacterium]